MSSSDKKVAPPKPPRLNKPDHGGQSNQVSVSHRQISRSRSSGCSANSRGSVAQSCSSFQRSRLKTDSGLGSIVEDHQADANMNCQLIPTRSLRRVSLPQQVDFSYGSVVSELASKNHKMSTAFDKQTAAIANINETGSLNPAALPHDLADNFNNKTSDNYQSVTEKFKFKYYVQTTDCASLDTNKSRIPVSQNTPQGRGINYSENRHTHNYRTSDNFQINNRGHNPISLNYRNMKTSISDSNEFLPKGVQSSYSKMKPTNNRHIQVSSSWYAKESDKPNVQIHKMNDPQSWNKSKYKTIVNTAKDPNQPRKSHTKNSLKRRSKSVELLDSSSTSTKGKSIGKTKDNKGLSISPKNPSYFQSTFLPANERLNIMEEKPLLAQLAIGVTDSSLNKVLSLSNEDLNSEAFSAIKWGSLPSSHMYDKSKWNPAIDKSGTVYVYSATGTESKWNLQEYDELIPASPHSPPPVSPIDSGEAMKEDVLVWRLSLKEGKKVKKSWVTSYVRYFPHRKKTPLGKSFGTITFSKKQNDSKKVESFDLVPPCYIDYHLKKQNGLCLRNADTTEVQLQAENPVVATEWTKLLFEHDNVQEKNLSQEKEKKLNLKTSDKGQSKKDMGSPQDEGGDSTKGIKDTLMLFFKRRIQQETLAKKGIYKDTVFGSSIGDICQKEQLNTPLFVLQTIGNIEKNRENFKIDGLYRISGNASRIQKIRIEVGQNRYGILEEEKDVHNMTGALKLFFRELKEPVIPFASYQSFIQATDYLKNNSRPEALRQAVKKLPPCNKDTLKILLDHLLKVNEYESENRMSIMNLAIVFGPCLLWPETTSGFDLMTDAMLHNRVVEALLSDYDQVFRKR